MFFLIVATVPVLVTVFLLCFFFGWWGIPIYIGIGALLFPVFYAIMHKDKWGVTGVWIFTYVWPVTILFIIWWYLFDRDK